ncbi:hypothetical protein [Microbacterium suwonense]|uniref:Uncharacterized protein n=1 Tax=Microbacterium suwonense TaxID=683047 RepID=A0ABM8FRH6_9MICO|nr:hypothetical protein [Microbacterium suwonense]BDZ38076.1 hypothetical protein GCM10025863_06900 [Microbacterium suwonense]
MSDHTDESKAREEWTRRYGTCNCNECETQRETFVAGVLYAVNWLFPSKNDA